MSVSVRLKINVVLLKYLCAVFNHTRRTLSLIILAKYYISIYKRFFVSFLLFGLAFIMIRIYELARLNRGKASKQATLSVVPQSTGFTTPTLPSLRSPFLCTFDFGIFRFSLNYFTLQTKLNQNAHKSNAKLLF